MGEFRGRARTSEDSDDSAFAFPCRYDSYEEYQHERLKREEHRRDYEKRESERAEQREKQRQKAIVSVLVLPKVMWSVR